MKTKVKRMSKRTLAVFLGVVMLITSVGFGTLITANAATTYYFRGSSNSWGSTALTSLGDNYYYYATQVSSGVEFKITDNTNWSGGEWNSNNIENSLGDVSDLSNSGGNIKTGATCYIMFNSSQGKVWAVKNKPTSAAYYKQMAQVKYGAGTAHEAKYGRVYFNNTTSNWSVNKVYFVVGHASYVKAYAMTALSNTKLYGLALSDSNGFGDAKYYAFVGTNSTGISSTYTGSSQNKTFTELLKDNRSNITYSSQLFTDSSLALNNSNNTYPFTSGSAGDSCSLTGTWSSNTPNTYFNKTQTINVYTDKASSSAGGSVSKSGYAVSSTSPYTSTSSTTGTAPALTSTYTLTATANTGYAFDGWYSNSACTTKLSSDTTYSYTVTGTTTVYANFTKLNETYTSIAADAKGSNDGSTYSTTLSGTPATISATSYTTGSSALTITAGTVSGYSFYRWVVTAGSGTIGSATTASTTFTPTASDTTVTAQYKKNYTFSNGTTDTHGTVTVPSGTVLAGANYSGTVTPADGYKIKSLTVGGNTVTAAAGKTSAYTYSGTTGSSTTGTSTPISVVATFEPRTDLNLYIAGRFRVRPSSGSSSWTTTYASGSDWNATSTNIPFTYLSGTTYKVDTYASLAELSAKPTNNQDPWFFVYDKTNSKAWHPTTQNRELGTTTEYNLTTNTDTYNVRFNSSSTDSPVTIYFDYNTKRLWYSVPDLYDVTVGTATGGTVTASSTRAEEGTEITLTIAPTPGYQLKSITAKDSSNATVTLSGTGNTRTFTMPAKNVTVTPVFEKITWSGLTAVGKYSTTAANDASYSNDFPTGSAPNVTIAATSATQLDGVAVSAPATDPTGYVFAGWYTTTGSFSNAANKDTTFYPNAANAVAIAKYKKIFTITSSVDDSGTGAGTATTSITSVEAGGSYTITATAASHSAVESVKVNGTAKTATASQTISSVSADQTVVVKFKSNVYLKGTMNSTAWAGDVMTANTAGTSYTIANVVLNASTTYQFRLYADDEWKANSVTTWTLNNIATHSTSGDNLTITPSVKAKVTFVSDGTKFTSITAIPYDSTTYNVTLTQSADYTITSTYMGVEYTTSGKNANVTVPVYSGTGFSYTVTPASGKYLSGVAQSNSVALSPAFSTTTHANSYTGTVSSVSNAFAVSATAASKLTVTAKTNKSARGTVSVNNATAYPGQTVTITVTPKNGILSSLVVTNNSTSAVVKKWQRNSSGEIKVQASTKKTKNSLLTAADDPLTFTMPNASVTVNATFDAYSAESTWYYNGYDTSGNALSGYHTKQMTEGMVGGQKFSYYHVEGRSGADQLMTVSDGAPSSGTRYVYFTRPNDWGNGWSSTNNVRAYFLNSSNGEVAGGWPGTEMTWAWNNDQNQGVYKTAIPTGATKVIFNDNNGHQTVTIDLTNTSGAYYLPGGGSGTSSDGYHVSEWNTGWADQGWVDSGTEYFYQNSTHNGDYTGDFNTKGFYNHYTASKEFAKPKDLGTNTGDYYINVLYPNTTYTINGVTKTTGSNPMIIWSAEPLAGDDENVKIYAKDGSIRSDSSGSTYANIADTKIYAADGTTTVGTKHNGNVTNQTYETYNAGMGDTIVIKTQIGATDSSTLSNAADLKAKYYVRGFCVNGEVSELLEWNADGLYTLTYKVPEDEELKKVEITPIYYLKDTETNKIVTYRVTGFTDVLKQVGSDKPNWGDTLYTYPFYGTYGGQNNAFGAYPGQPMVYYKGQYQMQIPQKDTAWDPYSGTDATTLAATSVSGITMSNGYYDLVHRQIMGYGDDSTSHDHVQTYDYGDFYKIFNEKAPVDNIVFDFKYETKKHNLTDIITTSTTASALNTKYGDTNGNGFELLTNFHGRTVDLFGTPLSGDAADPSKTKPLYVVSMGGVNGTIGVENIAGYYATEWNVYAPSTTTGTPASTDAYSRVNGGGKSSIPPEVLVLNDDDTTSFNTDTYPSAVAEGTGTYNYAVTDWKTLYQNLEAYRGIPVMISYEMASMQVGAKNHTTSGAGGATRNDGRWLYSKNGENITSKIKIQYSDDNGATYTDLDTTSPQVTGLSAYFTNDGVEGEMTYSTTIDPDKTFDFEAKTTNGNYKFVGWFMEDGTKITTDNSSHTERSGSYTFVAKFMQVQSGQLILSHSADKGTINLTDYQGSGTAKIGVVVKNGDGETVRTYDLTTSDITLDDKVIKSDSANTIEVTLEATATGYDEYGTTVLANPSGQDSTYFSSKSNSTSGKTKTIVLNSFTVASLFSGTTQNVKNIIYHSYFSEAVFNYKLTFAFNDRFGNAKKYIKEGKLTSNQAANDEYVSESSGKTYLLPEFYSTLAPHESNFGKDFEWVMTSNLPFTQSGSVYTCTATISSNQTTGKRTATFNLPYAHTNGVPSSYGVMDKASVTNLVIKDIDYGSLVKNEDDYDNFVTAPRQISDDGTTKNFLYWSIASTSNPDKEVSRCYYYKFNFVMYDNYIITPVYEDSESVLGSETPLPSISFLQSTRNQYNADSTDTSAVNGKALDYVFNDFVMSFDYNNIEIFKADETSNSITQLGYVVERVQKLEPKQDGTPYTDPTHYSDKNLKTVEQIKTWIENNKDNTDVVKDGKTLTRFTVNKSDLDNKNRVEFYEAYLNSKEWNSTDQTFARKSADKNYVYKAYTYMIVNGEVYLSDPAYFTMYEEATQK